MASRSSSFRAIVLRARESPAGDRIVQLLCPAGIVDAFAFGGPKSKLRSLASPWHAGRAWIYEDRPRNLVKLTDFDADEEFPSIRTHLGAIAAASLAAEFMLSTDALGGEGEESLDLLGDCLRALDAGVSASAAHPGPASGAGAEGAETAARGEAGPAVDMALAQFCLRALRSLGVMPDPRECASCAGEIGPGRVHSYSRRLGGFLCERCEAPEDGSGSILAMPSGAMAYLERSADMPFAEAAGARLSERSLAALKSCALDLLSKAAHGRLKSLESGLL